MKLQLRGAKWKRLIRVECACSVNIIKEKSKFTIKVLLIQKTQLRSPIKTSIIEIRFWFEVMLQLLSTKTSKLWLSRDPTDKNEGDSPPKAKRTATSSTIPAIHTPSPWASTRLYNVIRWSRLRNPSIQQAFRWKYYTARRRFLINCMLVSSSTSSKGLCDWAQKA